MSHEDPHLLLDICLCSCDECCDDDGCICPDCFECTWPKSSAPW